MPSPSKLQQMMTDKAVYGWTTLEAAVEVILSSYGQTNPSMTTSLLKQKMDAEALANPNPWTTAEAMVELLAGGTPAEKRKELEMEWAFSDALGGLRSLLESGKRSCGVQIVGDSTGNASNEWPHLFADYIAETYPDYTVKSLLYSATPNTYTEEVIQTGAAGTRGWVFPSDATFTPVIPASAITQPTGDIDIRVQVKVDDFSSVGTGILASRFGSSGNRGFYFVQAPTGSNKRLEFYFTTDGSSQITKVATAGHSIANGTTYWARVTLDVDNGASGYDIKFYTSLDGSSWTQLGSTVTTSGAITGIYVPTNEDWNIGGRGGTLPITGATIYKAEIRDGIDGPPVNNLNIDSWIYNAGTTHLTGAPEFILVNASVSGFGTNDFLSEPTVNLYPRYSQLACFFNLSHNDTKQMGDAYLAKWDTMIATMISRLGSKCRVIITTQNPRTDTGELVDIRNVHRAQFMSYAAAKGYGLIDTWGAMEADGRPMDELVDTDHIHPTPEGSIVQVNAVIQSYTLGSP